MLIVNKHPVIFLRAQLVLSLMQQVKTQTDLGENMTSFHLWQWEKSSHKINYQKLLLLNTTAEMLRYSCVSAQKPGSGRLTSTFFWSERMIVD